MGSGHWSTDAYQAAAAYRAVRGTDAFGYDAIIRTRPYQDWRVHPDLDPRGVRFRESRDSTEHPTSTPVAVLFDVTGSMGSVPRVLQTKLPDLFGLLTHRRYVAHPQILFGAVGDATTDRVPLQIGQFESDNRMDDQLGSILLEGGGGGQLTESYQLAAYFMARHTALDCHQKRGERGFLFMIGDEMAYPTVRASEVRAVLGEQITEDIPTTAIFDELRRTFDVYFILPSAASHAGNPAVLNHWRGLVGQQVLCLDNLDAVCETIALTVGLGTGALHELDEGLSHLDQMGSTAVDSVGQALSRVRPSTGPTGPARITGPRNRGRGRGRGHGRGGSGWTDRW